MSCGYEPMGRLSLEVLLHPGSRAVLHPLDVRAIGLKLAVVESGCVRGDHGARSGTAILPFLDFRMSIRKGESARTAVVGRGTVLPHRNPALVVHLHRERRIVDAVRVFINHDPQHRRLRPDHIRSLYENPPGWSIPMLGGV